MKTLKNTLNILLLLCLSLNSIDSLCQSDKALIKDYKKAKENSIQNAPLTINNRIGFYQSMDKIPRIVWGKIKPDFISKKRFTLENQNYWIAFYDFDNDANADQFVIQTLEGKELTSEFGFLYDLNQDGKVDYIIYNGGTMMDKNNDFYYFFYHWIDTDFDGIVDALAYNIIVYQGDTLPDARKVLWVMDTDKNGKPDLVDYTDTNNMTTNALIAAEGKWNYNTPFGLRTVESNDDHYFKIYTEYLQAINGL